MSFIDFHITEGALKLKNDLPPDEFYEIDPDDESIEIENGEDDPDSVYIDIPDDDNELVLYVVQDDELKDGDEIGSIEESVLLTETVKKKIVIKNGKKKIRFFTTLKGYKIVRIGNSIREVKTKAAETRRRSKSAKRTAIKTAGKSLQKKLKAAKTNKIRKVLVRIRRH